MEATVQEPGARGRPGKREQIFNAALVVLSRDGYVAASMEDIAAAAGVAKPTLYNHFGDKAALFAEVVEHYSAASRAQVLAAISELDVATEDLRDELVQVARRLLGCLTSEAGRSVMRLELVDAARLTEEMQRNRDVGQTQIIAALSGRFAELILAGKLRHADPNRAARHFFALVADEPTRIAAYGRTTVPDDVVERAVTEGVETFLAAFGAQG